MQAYSYSSLLFLLLLVFSCRDSTYAQDTPKPSYDFPHRSVISELDQECLEDLADWMLYLARETEKQALNKFFPISTNMEKEAGDEIHKNLEFKIIDAEDDRSIKLRRMLRKMLNHTSRSDLDYQVYLIDEDAINAFTIPGGRIYITTAIMEYVENDAELANILGHEIGHNENKHTTKIIQRNAPKDILGKDAELIVNIYNLATIAYGQPDELEADRSGFYLASEAGYDPRLGLEFWKRLARNENPNLLEKLFRSHPYSETRYRCGIQHLEKHKISRE